jgi:hypothetical protein
LHLYSLKLLFFLSNSPQVVVTEVGTPCVSIKFGQKRVIFVDEAVNILLRLKNLVRELTRVIAFLTEPSRVKILARVIRKIV